MITKVTLYPDLEDVAALIELGTRHEVVRRWNNRLFESDPVPRQISLTMAELGMMLFEVFGVEEAMSYIDLNDQPLPLIGGETLKAPLSSWFEGLLQIYSLAGDG